MKRSRGVTLFAVSAIVFGFVMLAGQALFWTGVAFEQIEPIRIDVALRIVALGLGCSLFGSGCGVLGLRDTARRWLINANAVAMPYSLVTGLLYVARIRNSPLYSGQPLTLVYVLASVFFLVFFGSFIWFFSQPHVTAQFAPMQEES